MICIFCGSENVSNENTIDAGNIILCNNCNGKYFIKGKRKLIINYPKYNINPIICIPLMFLILPIRLIMYLMETIFKVDFFNNKIVIVLMIVYANFVLITMIICYFQNIYNYIKNGFIIFKGGITTKEDPIFYKIFDISFSLIVGIAVLFIMLYMNINIIKYLIKI
jgi:DNA-directed RNA polymerase subunit RPC12/RpoP